ncbi:membrane protein required for colicin V production [Thiogranum longum]|uniref:Membrane protein required for colicin V production n=1 Tax=Thiogranum longum TaxID=1537524 RepID=A0A4R1HB07_9GAMM|nr:CvpA family protein [Thiogranum longum]TCK17781.1 membrane protein required for colicin V production [Thiogranum longum]
MIWVDYFILAIITISALLSLWRGFFKEALSLVTWVAALWVAMLYFGDFSGYLSQWIETPSVRRWVAFAVLFVATVIAGGVVNFLVGKLVEKSGLSATDRALGMVFGVARGAVIVAVLVMLAGLTSVPQDPWWNESLLLAHFQDMAMWLRSFLPASIAENIQFG